MGQTGAGMAVGNSRRASRSGNGRRELPTGQTESGRDFRGSRRGKPELGETFGTSDEANRSRERLSGLPTGQTEVRTGRRELPTGKPERGHPSGTPDDPHRASKAVSCLFIKDKNNIAKHIKIIQNGN